MGMMSDNGINVEDGLRKLPDRSPPGDLHHKIMGALPGGKKRRRINWNFSLFGSKWYLSSPAWQLVTATLCLAVGFYGGTHYNTITARDKVLPQDPLSIVDRQSAESYFYLGRSLLSSGQAELALDAFSRAETIRPDNPQYVLWQAVASNAIGDGEGERARYEQLIRIRPDLAVAKLNLAHNLLENNRLADALNLYDQVLAEHPRETKAMYNRALILHMQKKREAETDAWKTFLDHSRAGVAAQRALRHLYEAGDYSYRMYQIGYRAVILNQERLLGPSGPARNREVRYLVSQTDWQTVRKLNIVTFENNNREGARQNALHLQQSIAGLMPEGQGGLVGISWFGEAERLNVAGEDVSQPRGVLIFGSLLSQTVKENTI